MKQLITILLLSIAFVSCKKDHEAQPITNNPSDTVVYVSGTVIQPVGGQGTPCIWRNGVRTDLPIPPGAYGGAATIAQLGKDIYVVGTLYINGVLKPVYWKNGVMVGLTPANGYAEGNATGVFVSGTDVYIGGTSKSGSSYLPTVWKNDVPTAYTAILEPNKYNLVSAIAVDKNDVYLTGYSQLGTKRVPVIWKNGGLMEQPSSAIGTWGIPNTIAISGSSVYVAGVATDKNDQYWTGMLWKDNLEGVVISNPMANESKIEGNMVVNKGSVYLADYYVKQGKPDQACYWKDGVMNVLATESANRQNRASSIKVANNSVYLSGFIVATNGSREPFYWKDGSITSLPTINNLGGYPYDILIGQ